jgi:uncharacterized protein YqgC (DUF456 family)
MRTTTRSILLQRVSRVIRRLPGLLADLLLWSALVAVLEFVGPIATTDAADLVALASTGIFLIALSHGARAGLLPGTAWVGARLMRHAKRLASTLTPRHAIGLRPNPASTPGPDPLMRHLQVGLTIGAVGACVAAPFLLDFLTWLRVSVSYTLHLVLMALLWGLLTATLLVGMFIAARWAESGPGRRGMLAALVTVLLGVFSLMSMPGIVPIVALALVGMWLYRRVASLPCGTTLFCRRDADGQPLVLPVHTYLTRAFGAAVAGLVLVTSLGQSGRLFTRGAPLAPYGCTMALGMLATLACMLLVGRLAAHFVQLTGGSEGPDEPLDKRIWSRIPAEDQTWAAVAREEGLAVVESRHPPSAGYDLVVGDPTDPRRLEPRPGASREDLRYQIRRRFHVVQRRRFLKPLRRLFHAARHARPRPGSGTLLCPHIWLIAGLMRDVEPGARGAMAGPVYVGPAFRDVFPPRSRRYIGDVLRAAEIDVVYWEDRITWAQLRSVFGVLFECHDQERVPLVSRSFHGLPGVRVLITEEASEVAPPENEALPPPAGLTRVLTVMVDRGGTEAEVDAPTPSRSRPSPSLVS